MPRELRIHIIACIAAAIVGLIAAVGLGDGAALMQVSEAIRGAVPIRGAFGIDFGTGTALGIGLILGATIMACLALVRGRHRSGIAYAIIAVAFTGLMRDAAVRSGIGHHLMSPMARDAIAGRLASDWTRVGRDRAAWIEPGPFGEGHPGGRVILLADGTAWGIAAGHVSRWEGPCDETSIMNALYRPFPGLREAMAPTGGRVIATGRDAVRLEPDGGITPIILTKRDGRWMDGSGAPVTMFGGRPEP